MNAILQLFLNCNELTNFLLSDTSKQHIVNYRSKFGYAGFLYRQFLNLVTLKWDKGVNPIVPTEFKKIIGQINDTFSNTRQQDALDFLSVFFEAFHDETNIVTEKPSFEIDTDFEGSEEDLAKFAFAMHNRRELSCLDSLFRGQLKLKLICAKNHSKTNFQVFNYLPLPMNLSEELFIQVKLFRFPSLEGTKREESEVELVKRHSTVMNQEDKQTEFKSMIDQNVDNLINCADSREIPVKLTVVSNRSETFQTVIEKIQSMEELGVYKNRQYIVTINQSRPVDLKKKVDEYLTSNGEIQVYELANQEEIDQYFAISPQKSAVKQVKLFLRKPKQNKLSFLEPFSYTKIYDKRRISLPIYLSVSYSCKDLYLLVFRLISFVFKSPKEILNQLYVSTCRPFNLKVVNEYTGRCEKCMSITSCKGCILSPEDSVCFTSSSVLAVDFCRRVAGSQIEESLIGMEVIHKSYRRDESDRMQYNLEEMLKISSKTEKLEDEVYCGECKEHSIHQMESTLSVTSDYVIIGLMRFKVSS